ncbi:MAG: diacylglycerol/lipid kinase family protein [Acidimicrobiales bacterium]
MRLLLLVNSSASSVTPRGRVLIQKALADGHDVTVAETNRRGHASRLALAAARSGIEVVVVLGGDGTLNEAANGLVGTDVALAALPGGSTNVFARAIGLPNDPIAAVEPVLDALAKDSVRSVGLGSANGRYFLFHAGVGFDAAAVRQVERRAELKRWAGHPLFLWAAVDTWVRHYDHRRPRFSVRADDGPTIPDGYFTVCLNTNPYTFLGNRAVSVAPETTLDTGLGLATFRSLGLWTLVRSGLAALTRGTLRGQRNVAFATEVDYVRIEGRGPVPYQVDGDYLGEVDLLELRHEPDAIRLVLP